DLAGIKPGDRVLIHSAAGGVGMAAVQLARHWGAEVYATASPTKWPTLRAMGLDQDHIANSRTLEFADHFRTTTHGHGMDIILASLAGEPVDTSLALLAPGGRYIEMGKTDIRDPEQTATTHPHTHYQAFDLKEAGPHHTGHMLHQLLELFHTGALHHLPTTTWHLADLRTALRHMSQGRHTGKNIIHIPTPINPNGTVLITGGTGTLATLLAHHLVQNHNTKHLLLLSRQGLNAPGAQQLQHQLTTHGATTTILTCDTANPTQLEQALTTINPHHPLTAIIHTAGTLNDATLTTLTPTQLHQTLTPKIDTATHLHHHTTTHHPNLAAFILYSSIAATLGSPGQANYAAANTYLDALAHHRHTHHQPATSLAWGLWAQSSGMTEHLTDQDKARMNRSAIQPLTTTQALTTFDTTNHTHHPHHLTTTLNHHHLPPHPIYTRLTTHHRPTATTTHHGPTLTQQLTPLTPTERHHHLLTLIRQHMATILTLDNPTTIDPTRGFLDQGLDSLTAVELRNHLHTTTGIRLPATTIFDHPTPTHLTHHLLHQLNLNNEELVVPETVPGESTEAELRRALAAVPLDRLRDAGLMQPLLSLLGLAGPDAAAGTPADVESIDEMALDDLVQFALGDES
ncbi:type I polyketide synthase, partial [Kitasatospora sp. LaBMicrA B282]|uniref:type I polyketide synthase n=1 Tax=Kitasatospora sp. LaBMicrA B282 TaxID=3420949 RepID=UPI003D0CD8CF